MISLVEFTIPLEKGLMVASPVVRSPSPKRSRFSECIKVQNINMSHLC